jgi:hypothetical protein
MIYMLKTNKINSFWKPAKKQNLKPAPLFGFNLNPKPSHPFGLKIKSPVSPVKLSIYPKRTKQEIRLIDRKPWGDKDKDKVINWFDCKPMNKKWQDVINKV